AMDHWSALLDGVEEPTDILPLARPEPAGRASAQVALTLDREATADLAALARASRVTASSILNAAWAIALSRLTGSRDAVFGQVVSGRAAPLPGIGEAVGLFVNTVPVRALAAHDATPRSLAQSLHAQFLAAQDHIHCPLAEIQAAVGLPRLIGTAVAFTAGAAAPSGGIAGLPVRAVATSQRIGYPIGVVARLDRELALNVNYDPRVFADADAERAARGLERALGQIVSQPDTPLADLDPMDPAERRLVLTEFNETAQPVPDDATLVSLIAAQAAADPAAPAVACAGRSLTRGQLAERSDAVAAALAGAGVRRGDFVALAAHRRVELVVGLLGILKVGAAYVPLDPMYPADRIAAIIEDAAPAAIATALDGPPSPAIAAAEAPVLDLLAPLAPVPEGAAGAPPGPAPSDAAYCLFTSGSTGRPKGVVVEHRNLVNLLVHERIADILGPDPLMVSSTNYSFDIFGTECWTPLARGFPTVLATDRELEDPDAFGRLVRDSGATVMQCTPSKMAFLTSGDDLSFLGGLKRVILGGEVFSVDLAERIAAHSDAAVYNGYGPTETSVWATWRPIRPGERVDIGTLLPNYQAYIMDGSTPLGIGQPGELCLAGLGVSRGYLGSPELTAQRFIPTPFGPGRLYRTGDIARWLPNGAIDFLGRVDGQVKLRGLRIELGEIAAAIRAVPGVRDAAAILTQDADGEAALGAYYVADQAVAPEAVLADLARRLPAAMIPAGLARIDAIPMNRSGKLDRRALPPLALNSAAEYVAPRTAREALVAEVFAEVLGAREPIGARDDFFARGGHSLRATRAVNLLEARTGVRLGLRDFFDAPSVEGVARALAGGEARDYQPIASAGGPGAYPLSPAQRRLLAISLMDHTGTAYNIPAAFAIEGELDAQRLDRALARLVERHEALRTHFTDDADGCQVIEASVPTALEFYDLPDAGPAGAARLAELFVRPFDLKTAPLIRLAL
ncbi:MAG: amino acid adenylation domain-containing protein, partial [Bifidobacteriaceae bacterium]|nr:amino acid adenylation domain-containing protein [Bifidobacteriaceae bacterium]